MLLLLFQFYLCEYLVSNINNNFNYTSVANESKVFQQSTYTHFVT